MIIYIYSEIFFKYFSINVIRMKLGIGTRECE